MEHRRLAKKAVWHLEQFPFVMQFYKFTITTLLNNFIFARLPLVYTFSREKR